MDSGGQIHKCIMLVLWFIKYGEQHTKNLLNLHHRKWSNFDVNKMAANGG